MSSEIIAVIVTVEYVDEHGAVVSSRRFCDPTWGEIARAIDVTRREFRERRGDPP